MTESGKPHLNNQLTKALFALMDQKKGENTTTTLNFVLIGNVFFLLKNAFTGFIAC